LQTLIWIWKNILILIYYHLLRLRSKKHMGNVWNRLCNRMTTYQVASRSSHEPSTSYCMWLGLRWFIDLSQSVNRTVYPKPMQETEEPTLKWMGQLVSDDTSLETTAESKRTGYQLGLQSCCERIRQSMSSEILKKFIHFTIPAAFAI
jgi:hypothetical protein